LNINRKKQNIAFFDFDGTLTTKDTLRYFAYYSSGLFPYLSGLVFLVPVFLKYLFRVLDRTDVFKHFIRYFYQGRKLRDMEVTAEKFCNRKITPFINNRIYKHFVKHIEAGDKVVVVSASLDLWLKPWCRASGIDLIATGFKVKDGIITGELDGERCYGMNKVLFIKERYTLENYRLIYAYGDSRGDQEMLELSDVAYYRNECIKDKS